MIHLKRLEVTSTNSFTLLQLYLAISAINGQAFGFVSREKPIHKAPQYI